MSTRKVQHFRFQLGQKKKEKTLTLFGKESACIYGKYETAIERRGLRAPALAPLIRCHPAASIDLIVQLGYFHRWKKGALVLDYTTLSFFLSLIRFRRRRLLSIIAKLRLSLCRLTKDFQMMTRPFCPSPLETVARVSSHYLRKGGLCRVGRSSSSSFHLQGYHNTI